MSCNCNKGLGDLTTMKDSVVAWVIANKMIVAAGALAVSGLVIYLVKSKSGSGAIGTKPKALLSGTSQHKAIKRHKPVKRKRILSKKGNFGKIGAAPLS